MWSQSVPQLQDFTAYKHNLIVPNIMIVAINPCKHLLFNVHLAWNLQQDKVNCLSFCNHRFNKCAGLLRQAQHPGSCWQRKCCSSSLQLKIRSQASENSKCSMEEESVQSRCLFHLNFLFAIWWSTSHKVASESLQYALIVTNSSFDSLEMQWHFKTWPWKSWHS